MWQSFPRAVARRAVFDEVKKKRRGGGRKPRHHFHFMTNRFPQIGISIYLGNQVPRSISSCHWSRVRRRRNNA